MIGSYKPYVPKDISELIDLLCRMMLRSPTFEDHLGYFPGRNLESTFYELNGGLRAVREQVGEELYVKLRDMSDRMRTHFEADPGEKTGDSLKGRNLIDEMIELLKERIRNG